MVIKEPFVPSQEFDVTMDEAPDPSRYDVVRVPADGGPLAIVDADGVTPLTALAEDDRDQADVRGPRPDF